MNVTAISRRNNMKTLLLSVILAIATFSFAGNINDSCKQFTVNGSPTYTVPAQELCKPNYAILYQCSTKTPIAVFEHLTLAKISGPAKRKNNFHIDPEITEGCRSTLSDYAVGAATYDRGHMNPADDNTVNDGIMSDSFFLSNMVPQVSNNNRGIWRMLEIKVRKEVMQGGDYYVITGPIFNAGYKSLGNGVGIPTRLYKIIFESKTQKSEAYILPNTNLPVADLPKYQTTVEAVGQATGMKFGLK